MKNGANLQLVRFLLEKRKTMVLVRSLLKDTKRKERAMEWLMKYLMI
jgi:hypothetical protein